MIKFITYLKILLILLLYLINNFAYAAVEARYIKVLIDKGAGNLTNGVLSISELQIIDLFGVNLAIPSLASSSSYYSTRFPAKAIDSDLSSVFATSNTSGLNPMGSEWLMIDLGVVKQVATIKLSTSLLYGSAALTDYRILISTDNLVYESVAIVTGASPITRTDSHSMSSSSGTSASVFYYQIKLSSASGQDLAITFSIFFGLIVSVGLLSFSGGVIVRMIYPSYGSQGRRDFF